MNGLYYKYVVIEDDLMANERIVKRMQTFAQWKCVGATASLTEALEIVLHQKPNLLFLDWEIKGGNTFTILEKIKNLENYQPYIIYFTGFQGEQPQIPAELINNFQVNKYLVKPIFNNFTENLHLYIQEAEELIKDNNKFIWLPTDDKELVKIDTSLISCISTIKKSRNKIIRLITGEEYISKINWEYCEKIAQENKIDYFFANQRECMVNKLHIIKKHKPFIFLDSPLNNLKVEVSKSNWSEIFV